MRPQYHLRKSPQGLLAWDVHKLIAKTKNLTPREIPLSSIQELDEPFWYAHEGAHPTCRSIAAHAKLIAETDLSYPIILDPEGRVMDGMHRVCKALNLGHKTITAFQFTELPQPDFINILPENLPYESENPNKTH